MSPNVNLTCLAQCGAECGASTLAPTSGNGDGLFQTNWYTRASAISMYTLWAGYMTCWFFFSLMMFWLRRLQPIKSRSPILVLTSAFGGAWLITNNAMSLYVTGIQNWPCPFSNWTLFIAFPLFLVPLPLRSLQLFLIFRKNLDKIEAHIQNVKSTSKRVTVVESRKSQKSTLEKLVKLRNEREAGSDFEHSKEDALRMEEEEKSKTKQEESRADEATRALPRGQGSLIFLKELDEKTHQGEDTRKSGVQTTIQRELGIPSRTFLENHVNSIFWIILILCFIAAFTRQLIPSLGLGPDCRGCVVSASGAIIQTLIVIIIVAVSAFSTAFMHYSSVEDQYRIRLELSLMTIVWVVFLVPASVLAQLGGGCEALREASASCSAFDNFTKECYVIFAAQAWIVDFCVVITFLITVFTPVMYTLINAKKKLSGEVSTMKWPNIKALTNVVECMKDPEAAQAFQKFCVQAFCIEAFLFYKDVQMFKTIRDNTELRVRSLALYRQYIDVNGNLFLTLPDEIQTDLDNKLASFAEQEDESGGFDYNFEPNARIFDQAQDFVLQLLERDTFPRFQASDIAAKMAKDFGDRIVHQMGLASAHLA